MLLDINIFTKIALINYSLHYIEFFASNPIIKKFILLMKCYIPKTHNNNVISYEDSAKVLYDTVAGTYIEWTITNDRGECRNHGTTNETNWIHYLFKLTRQ